MLRELGFNKEAGKYSKAEVNYSTNANGKLCKNCEYWVAGDRCKIVSGPIDANATCSKFEKE